MYTHTTLRKHVLHLHAQKIGEKNADYAFIYPYIVRSLDSLEHQAIPFQYLKTGTDPNPQASSLQY